MRKLFPEAVVSLVALLALALAGCSTSRSAGDTAAVTNYASLPPQPYTRIANPDSNTVELQIAVRKFVPVKGHGPVIWLVGTAHVGERGYYQSVQKLLEAQTVVLFEGVNAESHPRRVGQPPPVRVPATPKQTNSGYSMQSSLAGSLGLVFQLDAIDYDRTNFWNSDLSITDLQRLMTGKTNHIELAEPGEPGETVETGSPSFDALLQVMDGTSLFGSIVKLGISFIGSSPSLQATTRLVLVEALGRLQGDLTGMRGISPDMQHLLKVLIEARNQKVVDDLKVVATEVPRKGSIAVFYGTGHMDDLEQRLVRQMEYRPDGDIWFTAFAVDLRETGLSPGQVQMLRNIVKIQFEQMMPKAGAEAGPK